MADVFISYKRQDRELVRKLVRALQERGFTVWWDNRLEWGENWPQVIGRALNDAVCVVVVWTPQSVGADGAYVSKIVAAEATDGSGRNVLLPVRFGPLNKRPFPHGIEQEEDLSNWAGNTDDAAFVRIAARLETLCGPRTLPAEDELAAWLSAEDANNAEAFRDFARRFPKSRYASDAEPRAAESEMRSTDIVLAREAALGIVKKFAQEIRKPLFTPALDLQLVTKEATSFSRAKLFEALQRGSSAVLQADPGGGKTTALLDLALEYSGAGNENIGVYLRLKELASQGDELFAHLAKLESSRLITESAWFELAQSGSLTIFCDGWNELSNAERDKIGPVLNRYARSYPSAGLLIGTRPLAPPPLRGEHLLLTLQPLSRQQIQEIVQDRLGTNAPLALAELRRSRTLAELVRNPFFLAAFCVTREAGSQPTTRESLIAGMLDAMAKTPEHAKSLREVLGNHQDKYLESLAVEMMGIESVELGSDEARIVVNRVSADLESRGIERQCANAGDVLDSLRDHHCLIERNSDGLVYQFQHQLIEEWYAAEKVRRLAVRALSDVEARKALERILNQRTWTEPVLFAAERPAGGNGIDATAHMILLAMGIDPDFAAEIIAVAPHEVWEKIAVAVKKAVTAWLPGSKRRVIRFILKSGRDDFADILWETIKEQRDHHAADALQAHRFAHPKVLGPDWKARTGELQPTGRETVLGMLASNSGADGAQMALEGALVDPDPRVQAEVAASLSFDRFEEQLGKLLAVLQDEAWEVLVRQDHIFELWDEPWRRKAVDAAQRVLKKMELGAARIWFALRMRERGVPIDLDLVTELLAVDFEAGARSEDLFEKVANIDPEALSRALIEKLLRGERVPYDSARFIRSTAIEQDQLLAALRSKEGRRTQILAPLLEVDGVRAILQEFLTGQARWRTADAETRKALDDERGVLGETLYNADKNVLATTILDQAPASAEEIGRLADLIMRAYRRDTRPDERPPLDAALRDKLVALLKGWAEQLVSDESAPRYVLHEVAEGIATFPEAGLLAPLQSLIEADILRRRKEKDEYTAARKRGEILHSSSASMGYEYRYGQNMLSLATGRSSDVITGDEEENPPPKELTDAVLSVMAGFLLDTEFGDQAARVISNLRPDPLFSVGKKNTFGDFNLNLVLERRAARQDQGPQSPDPLAERMLDAVQTLLGDRSEVNERHAVKLACTAARMECGKRFSEVTRTVLDHGSVSAITDYLNICLRLGHPVDGTAARKCLDELDARREERKWEYWERWFQWEELLVLMIYGGMPLDAVERLLTYETNSRDYRLSRILEALGKCGDTNALRALQRLTDRCTTDRWSSDWATAVANIGTSEAGHVLLSFLLKASSGQKWHTDRDLSKAVARIAEKDASLRACILELARDGDERALKVVRGIVGHVESEDLLEEVIALPGDRLSRLAGAVSDALSVITVEDRPVEGSDHVRDRVPRAIPRLRSQLFNRVVNDPEASSTCSRLLQSIDEWREWYGEPDNESRHPDIMLERPWPPAAQSAWDAAAEIRSQHAANEVPTKAHH